MDKHVQIVGILHIAMGALGLMIGGVVFITLVGGGMLSGDYEALFITSTVGTAIAVFFGICSLPGLVGGIFLLKRANWARILILIVSVVSLLNLPFGTAVGIYSLWVLLQDETTRLFAT